MDIRQREIDAHFEDLDREDIRQFKRIAISGCIALAVLFGMMLNDYLSIPDVRQETVAEFQAEKLRVGGLR